MTSSDRISAFTEHSDANPSIIFPNHGLQILSSVLNLGGISLISYVFARRTIFDELLTIRGWLSLTWPRLCVVLVFVTSWAFLYTAGVLISGAGMSLNQTTCELGILSCIILYATTKILIYMFLMEKVWIVWAPPSATGLESRWKSPIYRTCVVIMFPYYVIIVLMFLGRIAELRDHDGVCVIGLQKISSMSLLCFDLFITFFLTALFVWPLWASKLISPKLKRVARRTLVASAVALSTSAINIGVLTYMHGRQLGWVCLTSCGSDVTVNAVVLFWVTAGSQSNRSNPHANPHGPATASFSPGSALTGGTGVARTARVSGEHIEVIDVQTGLTDQEQRKRSLDGRRGLEKIGYRREMDIGDGGRHDSDDDDEMKDFTRSMSEKWRRSIDRISLDDMKSGSTPPPDQRHVQLPTIVTHERSQPTRSKMFGLHRFSNAFGHHENRKETTSAPVTGEELSTMEFNHESQTSAPDGKHRKKPSRGSSISSLQQIRSVQPSPVGFCGEPLVPSKHALSPNRNSRATDGMGTAMARIQEGQQMESTQVHHSEPLAPVRLLRKWRSAMFGSSHKHDDEENPPPHPSEQLQIATVDEQPRPSYHAERRPTLPNDDARNTQRSDHNRQTENRYSPTVAFQTSTFGPLPDPLYRFPPLPVTSESMTSPYHDSSQPYVPPKPDSSYVFGG